MLRHAPMFALYSPYVGTLVAFMLFCLILFACVQAKPCFNMFQTKNNNSSSRSNGARLSVVPPRGEDFKEEYEPASDEDMELWDREQAARDDRDRHAHVLSTKKSFYFPTWYGDGLSGRSFTTRMVPGRDGVMIDSGAMGAIAGYDFADAILEDNRRHLHMDRKDLPYSLERRERPYTCVGIGHGLQECQRQLVSFGCTPGGDLFLYTAPVIDGPTDRDRDTPALLGIDRMRASNFFIDCRNNKLFRVPDGLEETIIWRHGPHVRQLA